jgi:hypothetical protein
VAAVVRGDARRPGICVKRGHCCRGRHARMPTRCVGHMEGRADRQVPCGVAPVRAMHAEHASQTFAYALARARIHTCAYSHPDECTQTHTRHTIHTHTHAHTHTHTHTDTHTPMHITHARTHASIRTRLTYTGTTQTHTDTRTQHTAQIKIRHSTHTHTPARFSVTAVRRRAETTANVRSATTRRRGSGCLTRRVRRSPARASRPRSRGPTATWRLPGPAATSPCLVPRF